MTIGIAIPAYKNVQRLAQCLDSIQKYAPELLTGAVVVDDSGTSEVRNALVSDYPQVIWKTHRTNQGFGRSATEAVLASAADIVILLNDDIQLLGNPTPILHDFFRDAYLFAVTFRSVDSSGNYREGAKRLVWKLGLPKILHNPKDQVVRTGKVQESSYAVGGHCAFRRDYFERLGGFDPLFDPFYWEDVDLCVRARNKSLKTVFCPDCVVQHDENGAIRSAHQQDDIRLITFRNRLLFARRHCPAGLKQLLSFSIFLQRIQAKIKHDSAIPRAIDQAEMRWADYRSSIQTKCKRGTESDV